MKKFSTYSKKKKTGCFCCIFFIGFIVIGFGSVALMMPHLSADLISDIEVINENGATGDAFVAYRPGVSTFQQDMTDAFIEGLVENDWKVKVTTISSQTPTDLSSYDLLVFGSPTYGGKPHDSVEEFFNRVNDLGQTNVAIVVTSGTTDTALTVMENLIEGVNGKVVLSLSLHLIDFTARDKSYQSGKELV